MKQVYCYPNCFYKSFEYAKKDRSKIKKSAHFLFYLRVYNLFFCFARLRNNRKDCEFEAATCPMDIIVTASERDTHGIKAWYQNMHNRSKDGYCDDAPISIC